MNNMTTKELFKFLPKYKAHKNVSASKIKNVVIFGVTDAPLWGCIELVEPKGATVCVDAMFLQKHRPKTGGYLIVYENGYLFYARRNHLRNAMAWLTTPPKMEPRSSLRMTTA